MKSLLVLSFLFSSLIAQAQSVGTRSMDYKSKSETMEAFIAVPDIKRAKHPAVLIVHDWMGPSDFTKEKAQQLAQMGYVAMTADIYGKKVRPKSQKEASELAGKYKKDPQLFRERLEAALETLKKLPEVDSSHIVAMGYCFGGTGVLELARSGAPIAGFATFHGGLATANTKDARNIKGKLLIMHGAVDPFVPDTEVMSFQKEMNDANVDYQFISYSGAVHAFAIPKAGFDVKTGAAYNAAADRRSWQAFSSFLQEVAPQPK